jgi:hypothetical protein
MKRTLSAVIAVLACVSVLGTSGAAASSSCGTVVVHGTDDNLNGQAPASVMVKPCERIKVEFVFATQATLVYLWQVTHKPAEHLVQLVSHGYGAATSETSTQVWVYRAVRPGTTSIGFGDFTPSYPHRSAASTFKLSVTVKG